MDNPQLDQVRSVLIQALDSLDAHGVPGALITCLLSDGASLIRAGGVCTDLHGACLGLHVTVTAIRDLALSEQRNDSAGALQTAADAIQSAIQATLPQDTH